MVKKHISKILPREKDTHKRDFGHVFVLAGSTGMTGAAFLTSQAAILSGSGLVTCGIPKSFNLVMETKLTEVMTLPLPETRKGAFSSLAAKHVIDFAKNADVLAVGPGISRESETKKFVKNIIKSVNKPIVLDADGIIALVGNKNILHKRKASTVITPHPGEMAKLIGKDVKYVQQNREKVASDFAKKNKIVVVLKGYKTVVASEDGETYINSTGNPGMSTAGTGDVLTGMIASFIGQGVNPYSSAAVGVYVHGFAGDLAAKVKGQISLIASDLLDKLPQAINEVI